MLKAILLSLVLGTLCLVGSAGLAQTSPDVGAAMSGYLSQNDMNETKMHEEAKKVVLTFIDKFNSDREIFKGPDLENRFINEQPLYSYIQELNTYRAQNPQDSTFDQKNRVLAEEVAAQFVALKGASASKVPSLYKKNLTRAFISLMAGEAVLFVGFGRVSAAVVALAVFGIIKAADHYRGAADPTKLSTSEQAYLDANIRRFEQIQQGQGICIFGLSFPRSPVSP